jgi:hypothetical protein
MRYGPRPGSRVARLPAANIPAARSVFLNCPFDNEYRPILRAMVFTIIASGYRPRCALDSCDGAEVRVMRIAALIGACDWAIHDLSRVEPNADGVPRFNMPMELGLHLGARVFGIGRQRRKRALILDSVAHRYDAALSDISGQDVAVHANDPDDVIGCVRNWLSEHRGATEQPLPGVTAMRADYRVFQAEIAEVLRIQRLDPLENLSHNDLLWALGAWIAKRAEQFAVAA